jgi:hypothetical protein
LLEGGFYVVEEREWGEEGETKVRLGIQVTLVIMLVSYVVICGF